MFVTSDRSPVSLQLIFVGLTYLVTSALVVAGCWSILREDVARLSLLGGTGINMRGRYALVLPAGPGLRAWDVAI